VKKQLIRTVPKAVEKTARTRLMERPMRCTGCGITRSASRMAQFTRKGCTSCKRAKEPKTKQRY
jgi:predicted Zn-ribbon and HTH transcriptional regulator